MSRDISLVTYVLLTCAVAFVMWKLSKRPNLEKIPTVGSSHWLLSYWDAIKFTTSASSIIQKGYIQYKGRPFKVADFPGWRVCVGDTQLVEEIRRAPEDELSSSEAAKDGFKFDYTFGPEVQENPYQIAVIRSHLTRSLAVLFPDIRDEIVTAFNDVLDLKDHEWKSIPVCDAIQQVVCRTSNRVFVGLPLCRDPDWIDLNIRFAVDVLKMVHIINLFPDFMVPLVARMISRLSSNIRRGMELVGPLIKERQKYINAYGKEWEDKPNDMLAWLMDAAKGTDGFIRGLTQRLLTVNFGGVHSSSQSFTQALFSLAANPQYIQPLREEVESVVQQEGWSKAALAKMRKIDSFLKESERMESIASLGVVRKAMKDFTFSDGTVIPKGVLVAVTSFAIHHDNSIYENADVFKPFRFADVDCEDSDGSKHQFASPSAEYLPFGLGRHACPGRFFASSELKAMLAHVVITYDVKLKGPRPRTLEIGMGRVVDPTAEVMFKRRAT